MEIIDLKRKIVGLWKDNFHNSDNYFNHILDNYLDPELVEYSVNGPELTAAVVGIPYEFGGEFGKIKGLFLYGAVTKQKYRGQGIMSKLLENINKKAEEKGYAFTFVVPQTERLIRFYDHRGFVKAFYHSEQNYTSLHDFKADYYSILDAKKDKVTEMRRKYFTTLSGNLLDENTSPEVVEKIKSLVENDENSQLDMEVLHTQADIDAAIRGSKLNGQKIYYTMTQQGDVTSVAFTKLKDRSRVDVDRIYSSDLCSWYRLLDHIKKEELDAGIRVYCKPKDVERKELANVHGMAKILNLYEILKFQAICHGDLKYSILVNEVPGAVECYDVRNGKVKHRSIPTDGDEFDKSKTVMSLRDISCVLFRRPDKGALVAEAFGMPSVNGYLAVIAG